MPINNALTPEGLNALGAAFGFYPQLRRNRTVQDPRAALDMPVQALRGRVAATLGTVPDILNMLRTPLPMEMYGDTDYGPQTQVPYGSQELLKTLPLPPQGPAQQAAANLGALAPMTPAEALQAARLVRQAALASGKTVKQAAKIAGEELNAAMMGERPGTLLGAMTPQPLFAVSPKPTVMRPQRNAYPEIYSDPRELAAEAASRVAKEDPLLQQLFGVSRQDLFDISQQGTRAGNITERPFKAAANAKGAAHASEVMNPRNENRLLDLIKEAKAHPDLYQGMASWYTMDPLFQQFKKVYGAEKAVEEYNKFNTLTGMASPGSEVLTEFNRGTGANWLSKQNRFEDFQKYGGLAEFRRGADFPEDMRGIIGHPYHSTAHSGPMSKYVESGVLDMGSAKVPSYIHASGVPETGFQTQWPVGDAHWSRIVGLPDVRGATTKKGVASVPNASASVPEMTALGPWWKNRIAAQAGIEAVPAQAVVWGAGSGATGVTSPIGAGKLELLAQQIGKAAKRMDVSPEVARDMIIRGEAHAGFIDAKLAAAIAGASAAGLLGNEFLRERK
jgi:hypothetical protein